LRAVSVGFMPLEMTRYVDLEGHMTGYEFTSQELLELSAVPIPANPEALARLAVALAKATLAKANEMRALLEAAGVRSESGDLTLEELLAAVKGTGTSVEEDSTSGGEITSIESVEQLGDALETGIAEFEKALGLGDEERHPAGSRKWRDPGRLRKK
jgi:hypothetical protein